MAFRGKPGNVGDGEYLKQRGSAPLRSCSSAINILWHQVDGGVRDRLSLLARAGKLELGVHRLTGFTLVTQEVFDCILSPGLSIRLLTPLKLLSYSVEFPLELIKRDPVSEEILHQPPDSDLYGR
jgi:hypothetical protein